MIKNIMISKKIYLTMVAALFQCSLAFSSVENESKRRRLSPSYSNMNRYNQSTIDDLDIADESSVSTYNEYQAYSNMDRYNQPTVDAMAIANESNVLTHIMYQHHMNKNSFLLAKNNGKPIILSEAEKKLVADAIVDVYSSFGKYTEGVASNFCNDVYYLFEPGCIDFNYRDIKNFKGDTFVIGSGRKGTGIASIEKYNYNILNTQNMNIDEEHKKILINKEKEKIQEIKDTYYTFNCHEAREISDPDIIGSTTALEIFEFIQDNRFRKVYFENANAWTFLNSKTLRMAKNICMPEGTIEILTDVNVLRLLIVALENRPDRNFYKNYLQQLKDNYDKYIENNCIRLEVINKK